MMRWRRLALAAALLVSIQLAARAQNEAAQETDPAAPAAAQAAQRFESAMDELRETLKQLRARQVEWLAAKPQDRKALEPLYFELADRSDALVEEVQAAAEAAYSADPENAQAEEFLAHVIRGRHMTEDNYEVALRLARLMIEKDPDDPETYMLAGHAAFQACEFELAKEYLSVAKEKDALVADPGEKYLSNIDFYIDAWKKEEAIRAAEAEADDLPRVIIKTNRGDITVELFENEAPNTVANFISLVEKKFYDGLAFHRVLPGFMAQGGDPKGDGTGGPGYHIPCECYQENRRLHFRGSLSMAHAGRDTGGSQFFIMFAPSGPAAGYDLNGKHTVFGRIIDGMEVLARLKRRDPEKENQPKPDRIVEARVLRKRDHAYQPMTLPGD
jgi:cyclophilin family peptidyl-prolyl cis-trans isomerase